MHFRKTFIVLIFFILFLQNQTDGQENFFGHYFISTSASNPAHAGDTRFAQFQFDERIQPTVTGEVITNTYISYDQKLRNQRSGIAVSVNQKTAKFNEQNIKLKYSYTLLLFRKYWVKAGLGASFTSLQTHANTYKFPDQYDNYGFIPGSQTAENITRENEYYTGLSAGFSVYDEYSWLSVGLENLNRPGIEIIQEEYRAPTSVHINWGMLFPINKYKRPRRIISSRGGLDPYSSIGPIISIFKNGPYHMVSIGVNAFTKPVFWGVNFRYNAVYDEYLTEGASSLNFMAGYRMESLCIAYSYDFMLNQTPTNFKGAHEFSLIYYLFSVKEDYKKNKLFPFPNQLMY